MPRRVKQINDLVIDEISLVDKGANQHATVTIAKSASGEKEKQMEIFDEQGNPLDPEALEDGDVVYGEDGSAYLFELDGDQGEEYDDEDAYEGELAEVGKSWSDIGRKAEYVARTFGRKGKAPRGAKDTVTGIRGALGPAPKPGPVRHEGSRRAAFGQKHAEFARNHPGAHSALIYGGAGTAGAGVVGGAGYGAYRYNQNRQGVGKSLAQEVREELSKALTDRDRDDVISKALSYVEDYAEQAEAAEEIAKAERDLRLHREYTEIAKSYELPIDDEVLGGVLMRCAENLSYEDCTVIAKALEVAGEAGLYDEYGAVGGGDNSDVLAQVNAFADSQVSKSGMSREEFSAELFGAHPELYDEFLAERRGF